MKRNISIFIAVLAVQTADVITTRAAQLITTPAAGPANTSAGGNSFNPAFSADGRHLVFVSHANNLVTNDDLGLWLDVFVHDLVSSNTVLVSVSTNGIGGANADANYPSISSNGQFIAFASRASNLVPGDTNAAGDVFLRDVASGTTRLISVNANGNSPVDPAPSLNIPLSGYPLISGDGRWVFFESRATNLTAGGAPLGSVNIYARDTWSNVTALVSADATGTVGAEGESSLGSVTPDARFVAFSSTATNIITGLTNTGVSVYLRDMQSGQIVWATTNCIGCDNPVIDTSGRIIAYFGQATASVYRHDRVTGENLQLGGAINLFKPILMSADGNVIANIHFGGGSIVVYVWTPTTGIIGVAGTTTAAGISSDGVFLVVVSGGQLNRINLTNNNASEVITIGANAPQSAGSFDLSTVAVSSDGSRVAFDAPANDLVVGDLNGASDIFLRDVNAGVTELITKAQSAKPAAGSFAHSYLGLNSVSADGRFVVTLRYDDPAAYRDTNRWQDVFVSDVVNGLSVPVSISSNAYVTNVDGGVGGPVITLIENTNAYQSPVISADGSVIYAIRRTPQGQTRVYGATRSNALAGAGMALASRGTNVSENGNSYGPSVSSNGMLLVFTSTSSDLVAGISDGGLTPDVFLRRTTLLTNGLLSGSNELVSISVWGTSSVGSCSNGIISPDGRWVIFDSMAGNSLVTNFAGSSLFVRDLWSNVTRPAIAPRSLGASMIVSPGTARISADSRSVVFAAGPFVTYSTFIIVHNLLMQTNIVVDNGASLTSPAIGGNGRFVAYQQRDPVFFSEQIYARDLQSGQVDLVSANRAGGPGNQRSSSPLISGDGRYIVFQSQANDLVANDSNDAGDIFVRDRLLGVTMLVSANAQGLPGNGPSSRPVLAADGRTVVFQSFANDLVGHDYNDKRDVFVLKLGGTDTDGDGMDDDWEVAYFANLSRDGSGDLDDDGVSDLQEFRAGTDPTNGDSIFRVLTVTPMGGGSTRVIWTGNPNRSYRVEFKDDLSADAWTALNGMIAWNGSTASATDTSSVSTRFYRVVRLP